MSLAERGHRTLPQTLDYLASNQPNRIYASVPLSSKDLTKGFCDVTTEQVRRIVDTLAHWIKDTIGTSDTFETLAYIGVTDLRYPVMILAAIKCGYKVLLISPRNPSEQNVSLLKQTHCSRIFYAPETQKVVDGLHGFEAIPLAPWQTWLDAYTEPYPFTKTFEQCKDDPIVVVHSSGSTGQPKPIVWTHAYFAADDIPVPDIPGRQSGGSQCILEGDSVTMISLSPLFHMGGCKSDLFFPLFSKNASLVMTPHERVPNHQLLKEMIRTKKNVSIVTLAPIHIECMVRDPEGLEMLKQLDAVCFGSSPLSPAIGDILFANGVNAFNIYGQSEMGFPRQLKVQDTKDWSWFEFHPCLKFEFEPAADGKFELIMNPDAEAEKYRGSYGVVCDKTKQIRTKDLFTRHPTKPDLWQFYARTDDVIVFNSGRKWFPLPSEAKIMAHPKVRGAMIVGTNQSHPLALVEGDDGLTADELWPTIKEINSHTQEVGRLEKKDIVILPVGGLVRTPKSSIVRKLTVEAHADLIEKSYARDKAMY